MDKTIGKIGDDENQDETKIDTDNESKKTNEKHDDPRLSDQQLPKYQEKTYVPGRGMGRYKNSLKNFIPIRRKEKEETETMGIDSAGLFSSTSISWISKFIYRAYSKGLKLEEIPGVSPYDTCDYNADRLELLWKNELAKRGPETASFSRVAWRFCSTRIIAACLIQTFAIVCGFLSNSFLMRKLLEWLQLGNGSYEEGVKWALLLTASESARIFLWALTEIFCHRTGLRLRTACLALVYRKIIRVNNLETKNIGQVINIFSNDAQNIFDVSKFAPRIFEAPICSVYAVLYVLWLLGPMALIGMIAFVAYYPLQYMMSQIIGRFQAKTIRISDMRVRLMNEILDCIKLIKMYAWEKRFSDDLLGKRKKERKFLLITSYCQSLNASVGRITSAISTIITFLAHVSVGNNLTASQAFPYASFVDSQVRTSINYFRLGLGSLVSVGISLNRIKSLLLLEDDGCYVLKQILGSQAVTISHGTFAVKSLGDQNSGNSDATAKKSKEDEITRPDEQGEQEKLNKPPDNAEHVDILFDISFEAEKGKLIGICGQVGSGKSSLLLAALGQLRVSEGQVTRDGSCAYVSQQAWITNATLRENILFGSKFDHRRYHEAIHACNLVQDIEMMPGGDQTEIGEKGVNLSGGQKQRVALARALYADRDIYFLDDPLSAVDSRVGSYIFDNLILGALRGKTVLFVTHQIQYLNRCDEIYMMQNGRIIEHGTHDELMKVGNEYALMVTTISMHNEKFVDQKNQAVSELTEDFPFHKESENHITGASFHINAHSSQKPNAAAAVPLTVAEELQQKTVKAHTYHAYILAAGGYFFSVIVISMFVINIGSTAFSSWWLAKWIQAGGGNETIVQNNVTIISDNINDNPDFSYYQAIYGCSLGIVVFTSVVRGLVFSQATLRASTKMHNNLFKKIIASPMRFFDTTPTGRIQHLFSRDMDEVDSRLPVTATTFIENTLIAISTVFMISLAFPWFIIALCIVAGICYFVSKIFRAALTELKRMENQSRAPVLSFVTATIQGLNTIHAFGKEEDFMRQFTNLSDENSKPFFIFNLAITYMILRIDVLAVTINAITAFLVVAFKHQVSPAFAGLALSYSAQISGILPSTTTLFTELEARFISVERLNHYIRKLKTKSGSDQPTVKPSSSWPVVPKIRFSNVCMAYGEGAPFVLENISFTVSCGEKIGIVGRTGTGKSSLTVALFRLVEIAKGKIEIDDVDISQISISQLRTKLSIIPQDPVLFSETIRSNLDPFKLYTDAEIWEALEKTELKSRVQSITGQLDASVGFGGDNLSVGERQLLCLARALLRNSKILILDEATAAVDPETEIAVQNTVAREFANCTILTIAHRLQTVLSLSRVLVMDDGKILEFDTPSNLLGNKSSEFFKMMEAAKQAETDA